MPNNIRYISRYKIKVNNNNDFICLLSVYEHTFWELNPYKIDVDLKALEPHVKELWNQYKKDLIIG